MAGKRDGDLESSQADCGQVVLPMQDHKEVAGGRELRDMDRVFGDVVERGLRHRLFGQHGR